MGKVIVILLALAAVMGILFHFVGAGHMGTTAVVVPGTEHTPTFPITWTLVCGGLAGVFIWRIVKGK